MNKTILFKKKDGKNNNYDIILLKEFDIKQNSDCVKINEDKKIYSKIFNLVSDTYSDIEKSRKLTDLEEELVYGCEVDYDIIIPKSFMGKPFMIYDNIIKVKEKHIVQEHIPTTFKVYEPVTVNVKDSNIIVINYDFTSGKELSFAEGVVAGKTGDSFETNCLDFFTPDSLNKYCDVVVVKKDKSYISLKDLLENNDDRYTVKHMRDAHRTQKMLIAGSFNFKQPHNIYLDICAISYDNDASVDKKTFTKININNERLSFLIEKTKELANDFIYNCNTNIFITQNVLYMINKNQPYVIFDNVGKTEITKEDVERV